MLTLEGELNLDKSVIEFSNSLYNKWLQVTTGIRENFKKKNKVTPKIPYIDKRKIVQIDDDLTKGWGNIMSNIFSSSGAEYQYFTDFNKAYTREQLLESIRSFLEQHQNADCYIIDLRLHEEDSLSDDYKRYTGHQIAKYLYEQNPGNQIILFTASEKAWNYIESEKYCSSYVIKENPTRLLTRNESEKIFQDFSRAVQSACEKSYLKNYSGYSKDNPYLKDFFEILRSDIATKPILHVVNMRSVALNLIVFIESTIKESFDLIDKFKLRSKVNDGIEYSAMDIFIEYANNKAVGIHVRENKLGYPEWTQKQNDLFLICATLIKHYSISEYIVNDVIKLKNIRNLSIAHGNSYSKVELALIKNIFENVVIRMLEKEKNN